MPVYHLFQKAPFGPEEIGLMTSAYEGALAALKVTDRDGPIAEADAKKTLKLRKRANATL